MVIGLSLKLYLSHNPPMGAKMKSKKSCSFSNNEWLSSSVIPIKEVSIPLVSLLAGCAEAREFGEGHIAGQWNFQERHLTPTMYRSRL